jgi:hypothetical protein
MASSIIPFELHLQPALPTVLGNIDYQHLRQQFHRIDELLIHSSLEKQFVQECFAQWQAECAPRQPSAKAQLRFQEQSRRALRCNIARILLGEAFRDFAVRLADSPLLQSFCGLSRLDKIRVPSKSALERYNQWAPEAKVRELVGQLLRCGQQEAPKLQLQAALDLDAYFVDTTCVKSNIHFPVDWILFRDATRTLMKSVQLIRAQGLKHRMEEPKLFMSRMNRLCIEMSQARIQPDNQRRRKRIFRKIDKLVWVVRDHARRYRQQLEEQWEKTEWTRPKTEQVLRRMDNVLEQLPAARRQARQRILLQEPVKNENKILSLYEPQARVIVRHKAGAEVEFGNTLLLGESPAGLIVDWQLFAESAPADSRLLMKSIQRTEQSLGHKIKMVGADRGFDSESNQTQLVNRKTYNAVCPRSNELLKERYRSWKFRAAQRRRAQTEGRVGIFKSNFLGSPLRSKGFNHRNVAVTWGVLTHNLWVMARLPELQEDNPQAAAA